MLYRLVRRTSERGVEPPIKGTAKFSGRICCLNETAPLGSDEYIRVFLTVLYCVGVCEVRFERNRIYWGSGFVVKRQVGESQSHVLQ